MGADGLFIVFTGNGKGKTTAALGMALRAAGHGLSVLILQFLKGSWKYGELEALKRFDTVTIRTLGSGFTWTKENLDEDRRLAREGWELASSEIRGGGYDIVILDEINVVLSYGLLSSEEVLGAVSDRPARLHVVATGRNAPDELIGAADLVTEMREVKHPFRDRGVKAQKGIEF
ncbi:MAG TPA: cob(I)yrinic acid a,c-diamide adenosyltransferase [Syntrophobacter fumaroxidans]|nr:cob(I)yrinic acid a,c-diamide adenosyltransferase [Syntrophobacter fumaroxidans]